MRVRLTYPCTHGMAGDEVDLDEGEAIALINHHWAEALEGPGGRETATLAPPETRKKAAKKKAKRKSKKKAGK